MTEPDQVVVSQEPVQSIGLERDRLKFAKLLALLCFIYFFTRLGMSAFNLGFEDDQVLIAIVALLSAVSGWVFGSSMGSAVKQVGQQAVIDKAVK